MRYFNKNSLTEVIKGVHDIDNNVIELPDEHWFFTTEIPRGKQLIIKNGQLMLVDVVELMTDDDKIEINTVKQQQLLNIANEQIIILERAIKYNRAEDADKLLLEQLELFTIDVSQADLSAPDLIFPELPKKAL
ncbi:tail fiber assembly protein [Gilliamella apicola]|uniref:Tail fiber assembly protein n=1 Tax=Gilliamella apicola TaxID=1196095 RepID=A0A2V4E1R6_9GAMM|nr:tail fiber assembly protein [Gilliamella apicola]PXZ05769.1 hypothetical protein DKK79_03590 [Gilliamella apicola]